MSARDNNPCTGRYEGCTADPPDDRRMCDNCRKVHNEREAARRAERRAANRCIVCGARAAREAGVVLATCPGHREYYRARAKASR